MSIALWVAASVLALGFLASGTVKLVRSREQAVKFGYGWAADLPRPAVKLIGVAEVAGAVGMIVPPASGVLPTLSPVAATGLAALMAGALIVHLRRREPSKIVAPAVLLVLTALLAISRFVWCPF